MVKCDRIVYLKLEYSKSKRKVHLMIGYEWIPKILKLTWVL